MTKTYTLQELSRLSGVSPRNIRLYISEELMPGPNRRGRGAKYTETHVRLLRQIERMQASGLSHGEMRNALCTSGLDDLLARLEDTAKAAGREVPRRSYVEVPEPIDFRIPITAEIYLGIRWESFNEKLQQRLERLADHIREALLTSADGDSPS